MSAHLAYAGLGAAIAAQAAGAPIPAETGLIAAGVLAARGTLDLGGVVAAGVIGAVTGGMAGYAIGRAGGHLIAERVERMPRAASRAFRAGEAFFARHGTRAVLLARWMSAVRIVAAPLAGMHRMEAGRFLIWNAVGGALWPTSIALLAYALGRRIAVLVGVLALGAFLVAVAGRLRRRRSPAR